jgi:ribonuclease G
MYNVDDAIAKIDGYVISIAGGGAFVGESKLIKIDEVRRTAAYASIVTGNGVPETDERPKGGRKKSPEEPPPEDVVEEEDGTPEGNGSQVQSNGSPSKRRRGRRGGRRRSRAGGGTGGSKE